MTSLAALRAGDMEKIQKLESELDRAATHRHNYEEKGRKYKAAMEEVCAGCNYGNICESSVQKVTAQHFPTKQISAEQIRFAVGFHYQRMPSF